MGMIQQYTLHRYLKIAVHQHYGKEHLDELHDCWVVII